jgi:hypothetical protein
MPAVAAVRNGHEVMVVEPSARVDGIMALGGLVLSDLEQLGSFLSVSG